MMYNAEKNLTPLYVGGKIYSSRGLGKNSYPNLITHIPLPHKSQMVNHLGDGGRNGFDTFYGMSFINKMAVGRFSCGGFQD